uniref:Uncharacterized protein n=1 Tax=Rhipicephalus pulchellus TaxID=72859 RepID=L7LY70_RHIPC
MAMLYPIPYLSIPLALTFPPPCCSMLNMAMLYPIPYLSIPSLSLSHPLAIVYSTWLCFTLPLPFHPPRSHFPSPSLYYTLHGYALPYRLPFHLHHFPTPLLWYTQHGYALSYPLSFHHPRSHFPTPLL